MKFYLLIILSLLFSSCSTYKLNQHAKVEVLSRGFKSSAKSKIKIQVPSTTGFAVAGGDPSPILFLSAEHSLSELAAIELRKKLLESNIFEVYGDLRDVKTDYILKVSCSEFIEDISQHETSNGIPTLEAGILLSTLAGTAVPGLGALVQTLEPLTGIALSKEYRQKQGIARFEFQIIDTSGIVIKNFLIPVTFSVHVKENAGLSASDYKVVIASTPEDAVRVAVEEANKNISLALKLSSN